MPVSDSRISNGTEKITRRTALAGLGSVGVVSLAGCTGDEGEYPSGDITVRIVGSEGGGTDAYARNIGQVQEEILDTNFRYEPGFAEVIRPITEAYNEDSDGYFFLSALMPSFQNAFLIHEPDDMEIEDFVPICSVAQTPLACYVNENLGISDLSDLLERYRDGELTAIGSQGAHTAVLLHYLKQNEEYDWQWENIVEYGGASPSMQAVAQEEVPAAFTMDGSGAAIIESEEIEVEAIAIMASGGSNILEDVPTVVDEGYPDIDFIAPQNRAQWLPPGTPTDIRDTLADSFEEAIQSDQVQSWSEESGFPVEFYDHEEVMDALEEYVNTIPEIVDFSEI